MTELQRQRQKYVAILPWYDRVLGVETTFSLEKWKSTRALVIAITVLCLVVTVAVNLNGLRLSAQDADSEYRNGVTALARSDYSGAIHFLQRAAEGDHRNSLAYIGLGRAYFGVAREEEALEAWEKAIDIDDSVEAHFLRRQYYLSKGWSNPDPILDEGWHGSSLNVSPPTKPVVPESPAATASAPTPDSRTAIGALAPSREQLFHSETSY